jgi:hypothetical protein
MKTWILARNHPVHPPEYLLQKRIFSLFLNVSSTISIKIICNEGFPNDQKKRKEKNKEISYVPCMYVL